MHVESMDISDRDGRTPPNKVRYVLKDCDLQGSMSGELYITLAYLGSRLSQLVAGSQAPYLKFHGKRADVSALSTVVADGMHTHVQA